jgi:Superinfection immunity protein
MLWSRPGLVAPAGSVRPGAAIASSYFFWILLIFGLLALYVIPTVIAAIRGVQGLGWIIVINLLPTGLGWLAALIATVALPRRESVRRRGGS